MSNSKLWMVCLFFCLLVFFSSLESAKADVVFQDNFGSGNFNNWTVVGSPTVVTSPTIDGSTFSAQFPLNTTTTEVSNKPSLSYLQAAYPSSTASTLEFYVLTDTVLASGSLDVAEVVAPSVMPGLLVLSILPLKNGNLVWVLTYPSGENTPAGSQTSVNHYSSQYTNFNVQANVWYKIDIAVSSSSNTIQLSINNSPVFTATNQFIWNPTLFKLGNVASFYYDNGSLYLADVKVSDTSNISQSTTMPSQTLAPTVTTSTPSTSPTSNSNSPTPTSSPTVPEFSWLTILPLLLVIPIILAIVRKRLQRNV